MQRQGNWVDASPIIPYLVNLVSANRTGDIRKAMQNQDMAALQEEPGFFSKLAMGADAYKGVAEGQDYIQQRQAMPLANEIAQARMSPFYQTTEGLQSLKDNPASILAGPGQTYTPTGNKYEDSQLPALAHQAGTQLDVASGLQQMYDKGMINPAEYARLVVNDSVNVAGKDGKTNPLVDQMMKLGTHRNTEEGITNLQATYNDMGKAGFGANDKQNALMATLRRGVNPEQPMKLAGIEAKALHYGDVGAGKPGATQATVFDPNTGALTNIGGVKQDMPRNTQVMVTNNLPAQETAFAKGVGEANAKQYSGAIESKDSSIRSLGKIDTLRSALKKAPSGWIAEKQYKTMKLLAPNSEKVASYEVAQNASRDIAFEILQKFKGATSEKELAFALGQATNPTMSRATQKRLLDLSERLHKSEIQKANTLIDSVESAPVRSNINKTLKENTRPPLDAFRR